jgi:methylthioribose-1-phosphate isomerase
MNVHGQHYRTIWLKPGDPSVVQIIEQRRLPFDFVVEELRTVVEVAVAIKDMHVRGAGLIGAAAGYGMHLAAQHAPRTSLAAFQAAVAADAARLKATRPTAVNLAWAVDRQLAAMAAAGDDIDAQSVAAFVTAQEIADEDAAFCRSIGEHGVALIEAIARRKGGAPINVLTHCNAGWLAFVDYGTATAPIYAAHDSGIPVHVWVDETRPAQPGSAPHRVGAGSTRRAAHGHRRQRRRASDAARPRRSRHCRLRPHHLHRRCRQQDRHLSQKRWPAHDNGVPFYVALPSSTIDWAMSDGLAEIPIEERDATEVRIMDGRSHNGICEILILPETSQAANYAFDVTPARLVTGLITERGVCAASETGVLDLYPEKRSHSTRMM